MAQQVQTTGGHLTDASSTITSGGTAQTALASNPSRRYLLIQNISDTTMWVNFNIDAVADQPSIRLLAGDVVTFESTFVPVGSVSVIGATTGKKFVMKEAA